VCLIRNVFLRCSITTNFPICDLRFAITARNTRTSHSSAVTDPATEVQLCHASEALVWRAFSHWLVYSLSLRRGAQQLRSPEQVTQAKDAHQLDSSTRPNSSPELPEATNITVSSPPNVEPAKEDHAPGTLSEAVSPRPAAFTNALDLPSLAKLTLLDKAYLDAFSILREDNKCSRFYGGPRAIEVLNLLKLQLKPTYFDRSIALRMQGQTSFTENYASGV